MSTTTPRTVYLVQTPHHFYRIYHTVAVYASRHVADIEAARITADPHAPARVRSMPVLTQPLPPAP